MSLLNTIEMNDGTEKTGIIDFSTKKHLYFFEINPDTNIDFVLLTILWKGNTDKLRFSVYCSMHYPDIRLPKAVLIPLNTIKDINTTIKIKDKPKFRKTMLKL